MSILLNRQFWTPLLTLSGSLLLTSGLFLLFHLKSHLIDGIHQLASIVFIAACAAHLVLNRKPLFKALGKRAILWPLFAVAVLSVVIMAFSDFEVSQRHGHGHGEVRIAAQIEHLR